MTRHIPNLDVKRLLQSLKSPERSPQEEQWLREQLSSKELQDGLWALGHAVFPEQLCLACREALPYYVHFKVSGENAEAEYPRVKAHLDLCPRCSGEYEELYQMVSAAYADEVPVAPSYPVFDFSFLPQPVETPGLDWDQIWEDIMSAGQQVAHLFTEIRVLIGREAAYFGRLPRPLTPKLVAVPVAREKATEAEKPAQSLPLPSPEHDLSLSLTVGPVSEDKAALGVRVTQISSGQPLKRARVTVRDEDRRVLISELTHEDGRVIFPHLGSGDYLVEVKHQGRVWELPMTFALEEEPLGLESE